MFHWLIGERKDLKAKVGCYIGFLVSAAHQPSTLMDVSCRVCCFKMSRFFPLAVARVAGTSLRVEISVPLIAHSKPSSMYRHQSGFRRKKVTSQQCVLDLVSDSHIIPGPTFKYDNIFAGFHFFSFRHHTIRRYTIEKIKARIYQKYNAIFLSIDNDTMFFAGDLSCHYRST